MKKVVPNCLIVFEWGVAEGNYKTRTEIKFEPLGDRETLVSITAPLAEGADPSAVVAGARRTGEPWFCFEQPDRAGSAVAALRDCWVQPYAATPRPTWNPDVDSPISFCDGWQQVPHHQHYDNAFKIQWEMFLRHVVKNEPFRWTLLEAAKGVRSDIRVAW